MPRVENWRTKYERQWKRFEKAKATVRERGYLLPREVYSISYARGGYKQAYQRIKQWTIPKLQRAGTYATPEGIVPGGRIMSAQRKANMTTAEFYSRQKERYNDWVNEVNTRYNRYYTDEQEAEPVQHTSITQELEKAYSSFKQKYEDKVERAVKEQVTPVDPYTGLRDEYEEYLKEVRRDAEEKVRADEHKPILDRNGNVIRERTEEDIQKMIERYYLYNKPSIEQYAMQKETEQAIQLYKDTYEAMTGKEPDYIPKGLAMSNVQDYLERIQSKTVMPAQDVKDNTLVEVQYMISSFRNRFLRYKVQEKFKESYSSDPEGTLNRILSAKPEVITRLQEAITYEYEGDFENHPDSQSSQWYNWWTDFLTGDYSSEDQLDYAESEYE